jgi:A/G-specific adenine glycosylase
MLRRTRAEQVVPIYKRFVAKYSTPAALAKADSRQLHRILKGLGLNWRIRQFKALGRAIVERYGGEVPQDRDLLMLLPGVSHYVADAVLVVAFHEPRAMIDSTIARVICRYSGIPEHKESRRDPRVHLAAAALVSKRSPRNYNLALLDLAASVCTPKNPRHELCPLARWCSSAGTAGTPRGSPYTRGQEHGKRR